MPMVTAVATLEPEMAAKAAQAMMVATPRPAGRWRSHLLATSYRSLPTLPVSRIWLSRI